MTVAVAPALLSDRNAYCGVSAMPFPFSMPDITPATFREAESITTTLWSGDWESQTVRVSGSNVVQSPWPPLSPGKSMVAASRYSL